MKISDPLVKVIQKAKSVCILTGAGISAESGIPTFRSPDGIWAKFNPQELASMDGFMANTELVWAWYQMRRDKVRVAEPNAGHLALVEMEAHYPNFTLVTQNVDNLHQRAGSKKVLELHGSIEKSFCMECKKKHPEVDVTDEVKIPLCQCGGKIRPDVVWFGEMLPPGLFEKAQKKADACDLFLCIGTSAVVYPAAFLPLGAKEAGAYVVEINAESTSISDQVSESIIGLAGKILPELTKVMKS